jgi:hypothetical protein
MLTLALGSFGTPAAAMDVQLHGLLDLALAGRGEGFDQNVQFRGNSSFDSYGLRLFAEADAGAGVRVYSQFVFNDATNVYVDGAYVMWTPKPDRDLHVLAGKIPWLIGTWGPRTYSNKNPLIGTPLMYQHHTTLVWYALPPSADALLDAAGSGQYEVPYGFWGSRGMAVVDDSYWDFGAMVSGSLRPFEGAFGFVNGTPGWGSTGADENSGKSVLGRVGLLPHPSLRLGLSGYYGPYLHERLNPRLPANRTANDYHQILRMADLEYTLGHVGVRAEGFVNTWETPYLGDLDVRGGYLEAQVTLLPGFYAAVRQDVMRFGDVTDSAGAARAWDHDVSRTEAGLGYRITRDVLGKVVFQRNVERYPNDPEGDEHHDLFGAQLSIKF